MRTLIFLLFLLQYTFCLCQSTTYKSFEGDLFIGGISSNEMGGISLGLATRYNFSDQLSFGIKLESIVQVNKEEVKRTDGDVEEGINLFNFSITSDYYFRNTKNRFFAGMELGLYNAILVDVKNRENESLGNQIGFAPRIGARLGWFRPVLKYHIVPKFDAHNFSAWDLTFGVTFGGKKK